MREPLIEARQVEKYYGQSGRNRIQVIAPMDLCVYPGEILALLGPSGSGKSTLLRMLTGLAGTSGGQVLWHNKPLNGPCENVSIVFQSFALFPWLTVLENVEAPLKARGVEAICLLYTSGRERVQVESEFRRHRADVARRLHYPQPLPGQDQGSV